MKKFIVIALLLLIIIIYQRCRYDAIFVEQYINVSSSCIDDTKIIQDSLILLDEGLGTKNLILKRKWKWPWYKPTIKELLIIEKGGTLYFEKGNYIIYDNITFAGNGLDTRINLITTRSGVLAAPDAEL